MGMDAAARHIIALATLLACALPFHASAQTLTPEIQDFGDIPVDTASTPRIFTLTNTAPDLITVTQVVFDGVDAARFSLAQNTCPQQLASQASCELSVVFSPIAIGPAAGILTVRFVPEGAPADQRIGAQLVGNGVDAPPPPPPAADLALALALDDAEVAPETAVTLTATVSNAGPDPAQLPEVTLTLPATASGIVAGGAGWACTVLPPTATCERATLAVSGVAPITVQFAAPLAAGTYPINGHVSGSTIDPIPSNNTAAIALAVVVTPPPPPPPPPPTRPAVRVPTLDTAGFLLLAMTVLLLGWRMRPR